MLGTLTTEGTTTDATRLSVEKLLDAHTFFWLDLDGVDDEARDLLLDTLHIHHLAVDDARNFGQRPKIEDYDGFTYLVVHGASADGRGTVEVHFLIALGFLVTIHRGACGALEAVRGRVGHHRASDVRSPQVALLYLVVDELVDSFFPMLGELDDRIDALEDAILAKPTEQQLAELFDMKRTLVTVRKVITPQRDMFAGLTAGVTEIPGATEEGQRYLRDLYDHLIRISDLVDSYRDLLGGAMDTHLSTVSNRLNGVMKQLTVIATVFLPLSFLTGFFGQNFAWLVTRISGFGSFMVFGIGLEVVAALGLLYLFRKRGWMGGSST